MVDNKYTEYLGILIIPTKPFTEAIKRQFRRFRKTFYKRESIYIVILGPVIYCMWLVLPFPA
jgi:hypothetical protein